MPDLLGQNVRLPDQSEGRILAQEGVMLYVLMTDGSVRQSLLNEVHFSDPEALLRDERKRWLDIEAAANHLDISRRTLDRWLADAPPELPGAPIHAGVGKSKISWRFDPDTIDQWARAFAAWRRKQRRRPPRTGPKKPATQRSRRRTSIYSQAIS